MSDFYSQLLKLERRALIRLLNSSSKSNFRKQEIVYKIWQTLEIDNHELDDKLLFYGVDKGYLPKEKTLVKKEAISLEKMKIEAFQLDSVHQIDTQLSWRKLSTN